MHVFALHADAATRRKVALHHALAVHLQDAAVGKTASDRLLDLGHIGPAFGAQQQRLGDRAYGDAHNHLIGQLGQLAAAMRPHQGGLAQVLQDPVCLGQIGLAAASHDGQRALFGAQGASGDRRIQVAQPQVRQPLGVGACLRRRDGGHVDHQAAAL